MRAFCHRITGTNFMRAERRTDARPSQISGRRYAFGSSRKDKGLFPLAFALGCWAFASPAALPRFLVVAVAIFAAFELVSGEVSERKRLRRRGLLANAPLPVFETMVTLVALSMRLSPIARDFVAASLFTLSCRFWRPARERSSLQGTRRPASLPCSKE